MHTHVYINNGQVVVESELGKLTLTSEVARALAVNLTRQADKAELPKILLGLIEETRKIDAFKAYRTAFGVGLKDAKDAVETMMAVLALARGQKPLEAHPRSPGAALDAWEMAGQEVNVSVKEDDEIY